MKTIIEVNVRKPLTDEDLAYIVITAVEQGIGYWAVVDDYDGTLMGQVGEGGSP
jgi:hypothetical protein